MYMLPSLILWNIWKSRNKLKFNDVPMSIASILESIKVDIGQLYRASNKKFSTSKIDPEMLRWLEFSPYVEMASTPITVRWVAPPINWAKLN